MNSEGSKLRQPSKVIHQPFKEINFEKSANVTMNKVSGEETKQLKRKASSADAPSLPVPSVTTRQKSSVTKTHSDTSIHKNAFASTTITAKPRTTTSVTAPTRTTGFRSSTTSKPTSRSSNSQSSSRSSATTAKPVESEMIEKPVLPDMIKKKKRAAWDTKGRLEDMEGAYASLTAQFQEKFSETKIMQDTVGIERARVRELEDYQKRLESKLEEKEIENRELLRKYTELQNELEAKERRHNDAIEALKSCHRLEVQQLELSKTALERESTTLMADVKRANEEIQNSKNEILQLKSTVSQQSTSYLAIESDNRALKHKLERSEDTLHAREKYILDIETNLESRERLITQLNQKIRDEEMVRRKLHNTIQELKGNIRVFCRVRPLLESERDIEGGTAKIEFPDQDGKEIQLQQSLESSLGSSAKTIPFSFDRVFQSNTTQMEVFEEISQLIQSALDGYNVCIFAYGQTGSGKTYTMEGPNIPVSDTAGMIPRAVQQIYNIANELKSKGWQYTMEGQFLEIYNETINDLLGCNTEFDKKKHEIKHEKTGRTTVTDITTVILDSPSKVAQLLKKASANRAVGATNMNERSSRSHSVFTLRLNGYNNITEEISEGVLNLIDLAGSERLSSSGSTGDRLKETQAINKSLSCLGDVISALATQKEGGHVPYRNSKLTYLLQNSLGGNSKTLMFVNISPLNIHLQETLCSLRFATKVNSCQIGTATMKKSSRN